MNSREKVRTTLTHIPAIVKVLEESGCRSSVRLIIGGAPITRQFANGIGVDGYADGCASAVDEVDRFIKSATSGPSCLPI